MVKCPLCGEGINWYIDREGEIWDMDKVTCAYTCGKCGCKFKEIYTLTSTIVEN